MKKELNFHVYVGTLRGAIAYSQCQNDVKTKFNLEELDSEITCMEWGLKEDIIIGNKNGGVKFYNTNSDKYTQHITEETEGEGAVVGLGCFDKNIIIGRKSNIVNIWNFEKKVNDVLNLSGDERSVLECMVYNNGRKIIATGGEHNDLKLWDLETKEAIFKAKSMGHDELNLPIPTTIRGISFIPNENVIACCTKENKVLLYDERAQRRPVLKFTEPKSSFTTITTAFRSRQCLAGTTKGYMLLLDLRNNKCLRTFKSFTGSVTSIVCDPVEPIVAATSLDRHLRIYNLENKELIYKEYLKMSLTKLLMKPIIKTEPEDDLNIKEREVTDVEYEDMFNQMEEVDDNETMGKKKRKTEIVTKSIKKSKM